MEYVMRKVFVAILFFLVMTNGVFSTDWELYFQAETLYLKGEYETALKRCKEFTRDFPESEMLPNVLYRQSLCFFRLGLYEESLNLLSKIAQRYRFSEFIEFVPLWSGFCRFELGDYQEAIDHFDTFLTSVEQVEAKPQALLYRALALVSLGQFTDAMDTIVELNSSYPDSELRSYAVVFLMSLLFNRELYDDIIDFADTIDVDSLPQEWRDNFSLYIAEAYRRKGEYELAEVIYTNLVDAHADVASVAYQRLYFSAEQKGDFARMETILQAAEGKFASKPAILMNFWLRAGIESFEQKNLDIAEYFFNRVWSVRNRVELPTAGPLYFSETLVLKGNREKAIEILEEFLAEVPSATSPVVMKLGNLYLSMAEYRKASSYYEMLLKENPESMSVEKAGYLLAFSRYRLGELDKALSMINDMLGRFPSGGYHQEYMRLKINVLSQLGRVQTARMTVREYLNHYPKDIQARADLIKLLFSEKNFEIILQESPTLFTAFEGYEEENSTLFLINQFLIGIAGVLEGSFQRALEAFIHTTDERLKTVNLGYAYPYVQYYTGWALYKLDRYDEAVNVLDAFITLYPEHELRNNALYLAGWGNFQAKKYIAAVSYFSKLPDGTDEFSRKIMFQSAKSLRNGGNLKEAADLYKRIFDETPESKLADFSLLEYAQVLGELGRVDEADQAYSIVPEEYPSSSLREEALFQRALLNLSNERYEQGRVLFEEQRRKFPQGFFVDAALYYGGQSLFELGEKTGALLLWEKLIDTFRESSYRADAMLEAAEIYAEKADYSKALALYTDHIALYPEEAVENPKIQERAGELRFLLLGSSQEEASFETIIDQEGGAQTTKGRNAMVELSRLYILEGAGDLEIAARMLMQVVDKHEPETAPKAQMLLGAYYYMKKEYEKAAESFLKTLDENPPDADMAAQALYRTAEMMKLAGQADRVMEFVKKIEEEYPESAWLNEGQKLLEGLQ